MSDEKIQELRDLEKKGIVSETCPEPNAWVFRVIKPLELPKHLHEEYLSTGAVRW